MAGWRDYVISLLQKSPKPSTDEISRSRLFEIDRIAFQRTTTWNPYDDLSTIRGIETYTKMMRDDQVKAALSLKKGSILSTGWQLTPAATDNEKLDAEVKDFVDYALSNMDTLYGSLDDHLLQILSAFSYGFSVTEIVYKLYKDGPFNGKFGLKTLKTRRPHYINFETDDFGNLLSILQYGKTKLPPEKFIIYSYRPDFGNFYGMSDLREAYDWWWLKSNAIHWGGMLMERHTTPMPVGTHPSGHQPASDIDNFRDMVKNIQASTAFTMPEGFSVVLHEAGTGGAAIFELAIKLSNMGISRSLLVPSLLGVTEQQDTGSFSQARKHFDIFMIVIADARRDLAEDVIQNQLIRRLVDVNFTVEEYPQFGFRPFSDENMTDMFKLFFEAITKGVVVPMPEDEIYIRDSIGFPEKTLEQIEEEEEEKERERQEQIEALKPPEPEIIPIPEGGEENGEEGETGEAQGNGETPEEEAALKRLQRPRAPNKFEKKADFQRIDRELTTLEQDTQESISEILTRSRDAMIASVTRKAANGELTTTVVKNLDVKFKGELGRSLKSFFNEGYRNGVREGIVMLPKNLQVNVKTGPGLPPKKALAFFETKGLEIAGVMNGRIRDDAKNVLMNAIKTGEAPDEISRKLAEVFEPFVGDPASLTPVGVGQIQPFRLDTILRTNSTEAFNEGIKDSVDSEVEEGTVIGFEYSAIIDGRQTDVCDFLDEKKFRPRGTALNSLTPPNHFNCRSVLIPITREEGPVRFIDDAQIGRGKKLKTKGFSQPQGERVT